MPRALSRCASILTNVGPVGALTGKKGAAAPINLICRRHMVYIFIAAAGQLGAIHVIHQYNFTEYFNIYNFIDCIVSSMLYSYP